MARLAFYTQTYNAEKHIAKAIESVLSQTYTDFVYYINDDCSSDSTVEIIKKYAEQDSRIIAHFSSTNKIMDMYNEYLEKIIHSDAEYLCYLDNDDWYEPQFAEKMIKAINIHGVDMVACASDYIDEETLNVLGRRPNFTAIIQRNDYDVYFRHMHVFMRPLWGKIYRLSVLRNNDIKFKTDMIIGVDTVFVFDFLRNAKGLYISGEIMHHYLVRSNSQSRTYMSKMFDSDIAQHNHTVEWLISNDASTAENNLFLAVVFINALRDCINILFLSKISLADKITELREILSKPIVEQQFSLIYSSDDSEKLKLADAALTYIDNVCSLLLVDSEKGNL